MAISDRVAVMTRSARTRSRWPGGERLTVTTSDPGPADLRPGDAVMLGLRGELIRLFPEDAA